MSTVINKSDEESKEKALCESKNEENLSQNDGCAFGTNHSPTFLVLTEDYPNNNGGVASMYVHTRNKYYQSQGISVHVLSFRAPESYVYDGVRVITINGYNSHEHYDLLIIHAANIKHHYLFLKKNANRFENIVFFYHGHEVLKINYVYSKPYYYIKQNRIKNLFQDLYDDLKLFIWRHYLPQIAEKSIFVFVSKWMKDEFYRWTRIPANVIEDRSRIIYNGIGNLFEEEIYDISCAKEYDFVTIRSFLDGSKYAVDLVNKWAENTPDAKFLVIGTGSFFNYFKKAPNITWINTTLTHSEIIKYLNRSKYALMPTRTDAQGLMMCEMAAFGIPVITSDIPVCHEVFDGFQNVYLIQNDDKNDLRNFLNKDTKCVKDSRFYRRKTLNEEYNTLMEFLHYKI